MDTCIDKITKAQNGKQGEMAKLIEENNGLVWSIVKRFMGRGYEAEDLYQIGVMGFIKAIKKFDISFNVKLSTYAVPYILGEIKRFIRDDGIIKVSRSIKELNVKIKEVQKEYFKQNGKDITIENLAKKLNVSKEEIVMAQESTKMVYSIEGASYTDEKADNTINLIQKISTQVDEASKIADRLTIKELIEALNVKEKEIILLRYYKEKTQTQVAKILGISQVQVSRIERRVLNNMKEKLCS